MVNSFEKGLHNGIIRLFEQSKQRNYSAYQRVMPVVGQCVSCSANLPAGTSICPYCSTFQIPSRTSATADTSNLDQRVFDYILAHEGTISISQAAQELSISHEILRTTIERLKASGLLKQA